MGRKKLPTTPKNTYVPPWIQECAADIANQLWLDRDVQARIVAIIMQHGLFRWTEYVEREPYDRDLEPLVRDILEGATSQKLPPKASKPRPARKGGKDG